MNSYKPYRVEFRGTLAARSPLHAGSGVIWHPLTDSPVSRRDGTPFDAPILAGSALKGVLRGHAARERYLLGIEELALQSLFGEQSGDESKQKGLGQGRVRVFDAARATGSPELVEEVRDHVRIEAEWGAAAREAKFDEEIVAGGTVFEFRCTYEGDGPNDDELLLLRESLRALQAGDLRCGAKSSIGYGRVELQGLRSRSYQRNQPEELKRFLRDRLTHSQEGFDNCLLERAPAARPNLCWKDAPGPLSHFEFDVRLYFHGNFLSKDSLPPSGYPHADAIYFLSQGQPRLKGSSLRGVLRDRASHIQQSMGLKRERFDTLFGFANNDDSGRKSRLETWEGVYVPPQDGARPELLLDHVAVDRISGFAADGAKFAGVALSAPAFDCGFRLSLTEDEADLLALWGFVLRDLIEGFRLQAGWAVSRGYGEVAGAELRAVRISLVTAHGVVLPPQPAPPDRLRIELGESRLEDLNWCWTQAQRAWERETLAQAG